MSQEDSIWEHEEELQGNGAGSPEGIPEGSSVRVLARTLSYALDSLTRVSLTPGPSSRLSSLEEQLQPDSSPEYPAGIPPVENMSTPDEASSAHIEAGNAMFKSANPTPKEELAQGACELPRTSRGDDPKTVKKNKDANCVGLKHKYELNSFQITGSNQEEEDDTSTPQARSTQDALISTRYKNKLLHAKMKACDLLPGIMVPTLLDPDAPTPAGRWDFSKKFHVLKEHSQITKKQIVLWGSDCMCWGSNDSPIDGVTYERQDQDWIYTLARNSCSSGLNMKVETEWEKLEGHQQAGAVYLWMILDVIVNITPDVAAGLKARIKTFGQKGLRGVYPRGENVERMVLDISSVADALDQLGVLPEDAVTDIVQGLSLASHIKFAKMFADYASDLKNPLMTAVTLAGDTTFEKISTVLSTALTTYASYCLSTGDDAWMRTSSVRANTATTPPAGFKCDNCLGPHYMNACPKEFDEAAIARNRAARGASGGRGGGRSQGRGGRGGRGRGGRTGYSKGKFSPPAPGEVARLVNNKAYAACKHCGWNTGATAHTTGAHGLSAKLGYQQSYILHEAMNKVKDDDNGNGGSEQQQQLVVTTSPPGAKEMMSAMVDRCSAIEKDESDPDQAHFAGMMGVFFQSLMKSKKE